MVYRSGEAARSHRILGLGVAALLLAAPGLSAQETGTITGRVVDEGGAGISGAQVFLKQPAISALTATASAAADLDPDRISFTKVLRLIRRTATGTADIPPSGLD